MRPYSLVLALLAVALMAVTAEAAGAAEGFDADPAVTPPSHQVVALYFHRTNRCPTCRRISSYIDEAIKTAFADDLKTRAVEWHMVCYEDPRNSRLTQSYEIKGPTLVVAEVRDGKVQRWMPMPKVWSLVGQKDQFLTYVQDQITAYLHGEPQS
jgi:hypothetical protein